MLVKTTKTRAGGGLGSCLDYLCGKAEKGQKEADRRGITRDGARLLAGDIDLTQEMINQAGARYTRSHTAGVLSFEEANIPEAEKLAIMESFEKCLLPGLEANEYNILWVEHRDKGRLELNWVVPRIHTATDAHLQPYYDPVDRPRHKAWQEMINAKYGYSSPDEPEKKQTTTTTFRLPKEKAEAVEALDRLVTASAPKDRPAVVELLNSIEGIEVVRQAKKTISIKVEGYQQNIRLRGAFYEQDYRCDRSEAERIRAAQAGYKASRRQRLERISAEYDRLHHRAATNNRTKYDRITEAARRKFEKAGTKNQKELPDTANRALDCNPHHPNGVRGSHLGEQKNSRRDGISGSSPTMAVAGQRRSDQSGNREAARKQTEQKIGAIFNGQHRRSNHDSDRSLGSRQSGNLRTARIAAAANRRAAETNRDTARENQRLAERIRKIVQAIAQSVAKRLKRTAKRSWRHNDGFER